MLGIEVLVKSEKNTFKTKSNKDGVYYFNNLPVGEYKLEISTPKEYTVVFPKSERFAVSKSKKVCMELCPPFPYMKDLDLPGINHDKNGLYFDFELRWNNLIK